MSPRLEKVGDRFDSSTCIFMAMLTIVIIMKLMVVVMMNGDVYDDEIDGSEENNVNKCYICFCRISCLKNGLTSNFAHIKLCMAF